MTILIQNLLHIFSEALQCSTAIDIDYLTNQLQFSGFQLQTTHNQFLLLKVQLQSYIFLLNMEKLQSFFIH